MNLLTSVHTLAASTPTTTATSKTSTSSPTFLIVLVVVFGALYFLVLKPSQRKRMASIKQTRAYEVGDEVVAGGMVGRVVRIGVGEVDVDAGDGIFTFVPQAVQSRAAFNASAARSSRGSRFAPVPAPPASTTADEDQDGDEDEDGDYEDGDELDDDGDGEGADAAEAHDAPEHEGWGDSTTGSTGGQA